MLKQETLNLLKLDDADFKDIFSICIGKTYLYQNRFIDHLGIYNNWSTNVKEGILKLDDKSFDVEYIGTTSKSDNYWYSSELESVIPDQYVNFMINIRKMMRSLNIKNLTEGKIILQNDVTGYNLSMIYVAFAPENTAYFCGSGDVSIYMFVKNLPEEIFKKINSAEFSSHVMKIISNFNVNHRLMVKALLLENDIEYKNDGNNIIAKFSENSILTVEFDDNDRIKNISGNLSLY